MLHRPEFVLLAPVLAQTRVIAIPTRVVERSSQVPLRPAIFRELPVRLLLPAAFLCLALVGWALARVIRILLVERYQGAGGRGLDSERLAVALSGKVVSLAEHRMRKCAAERAEEAGSEKVEPSSLDEV